MESRPFINLGGWFVLALTFLICTYLATDTLKQIKFGQGTIFVKGCAEKEIQSDFVKWQGTISASGATQIEAYEKLENDLKLLRRYIEDHEVSLNQVEFLPISTNQIYQRNEQGHTTNKIEGYELSLGFSIASTDIPRIARLSQTITTLIKNGISISSSQPQYFFLKIEEMKINMLGEASKDARLRAEALVSKSSGSHVGFLRSAQQGVFQITPAYSTSVSDYGELDTSSVAKRIKAVVTMEYAIDSP